jgi:hypothetical protein
VSNFIVTTNEYGLRTYDRELDNNYYYLDRAKRQPPASEVKIIHAIGDSHTMGWGVDYTSSYPAILDWMLPEGYRVLNLGVDGFGAIAATEKSMELWARFPASHVVYLFFPNDFEEDEIAVQVAKRSAVVHSLWRLYDYFRKYSHVANIPFAVRFRYYFGNADDTEYNTRKTIRHDNTASGILHTEDARTTQVANLDHPTLRQITKFRDFVTKQGSRLTVFILLTDDFDPRSATFHRYCIDQGIETHVLKPTADMRLARDGHLNYLGNHSVARIAHQVILNGAQN